MCDARDDLCGWTGSARDLQLEEQWLAEVHWGRSGRDQVPGL